MNYLIQCRDDQTSLATKNQLTEKLNQLGYSENNQNPDIIFTIGGDGTVLHAIHQHLEKLDKAFLVPIHTGTLGFFSEFTSNDIEQLIQYLDKKPEIKQFPLLKADCYDENNQLLFDAYGFNEIRIENIIRTQDIEVKLNQNYLEHFRGNGLCISGQAGSTAYNRSLKGAIIDDTLQALQLTEISGIHHQYYRSLHSPLILNPATKISLSSRSFTKAKLLTDYLNYDLEVVKRIEIYCSEKKVNIAHFGKINYYQRLSTLF